MPAEKSADKLGSRMGVSESLEILCPVLLLILPHVVKKAVRTLF